jgi:regulator of protease activity HflC (stomatin/prohibitin superfamily)
VNTTLWILVGIVLFLLIVLPAVKIVWQYQRGVVFRFGKFHSVRNPGLNLIVPYVDRMRKVDMRVATLVVEPQEVITRDNVTVQVDAVVYFQPVRAEDVIISMVEMAGERNSTILPIPLDILRLANPASSKPD